MHLWLLWRAARRNEHLGGDTEQVQERVRRRLTGAFLAARTTEDPVRRFKIVGECCTQCVKKTASRKWRTSSDRRMLLAIESVIRKHSQNMAGQLAWANMSRVGFNNTGVKKQLTPMGRGN
eukprot:5896337-Amphidinium_carterae.1